jgi:hypothetical protein
MANNQNDALLYRLQQMSLSNNGSFNSNSNQIHNQSSSHQQQHYYLPDDVASGIYENVEYTSVITNQQVTDLDAIDPQNFETNNAKAQPQLQKNSSANGSKTGIFKTDHENLRYAHTPQPSETAVASPIYENLQVISG